MFEKEAEDKGNEYIPLKKQNVYARLQRRGYIDGFQDGAEYAHREDKKRIEDLEKENAELRSELNSEVEE